jgi:hypothetical protein
VSAPVPPSFRQAWARWATLVESVARRPGVRPCGEDNYRALYHQLMQGCAAHGGVTREGALVRRLEELVRPWMSLEVLTRTERLILADLAARARDGAAALGVPLRDGSWLPVLLTLLGLSGLLLLGLTGQNGAFRAAAAGRWGDAARQWFDAARDSVRAVPGLWAGCLGAVALILAPLLWRRRA